MAEPSPPPPLSPRHWPTWLLIGFGWTLARWPRWLQQRVGPGLGALMFHALRARRRVAETNLALCFPELPEPERRSLLRRNFRSLGLGVCPGSAAWARPRGSGSWGSRSSRGAGASSLRDLRRQRRARPRQFPSLTPHS